MAGESSTPGLRPSRGRVLMVAYYFPPVGGVGVQRTLKFATYLPRYGWQPEIVAPGNPGFALRDPSLMALVPATLQVHRTRSLEPAKLATWARGLFGRRRNGSASGQATLRSGAGQQSAASSRRRPRPLRVLATAWSRLWGALLYPDTAVAWVPFAVFAGWRAARRGRVQVVYSTALPISTHLAGKWIARLSGRPWLADFRDPWIGSPMTADPNRLTAWLRRRTERGIVRRADAVVFATEGLRDMYARRYPERASRFVCIPNGYDRADIEGVAPAPYEPGHFHLLFAGSLYRSQELEVFLDGVERLLARRPDLRDRLRVHFLGKVNEANRAIASRYADPARLGGVVAFEAFVPRPQALARIAGADALLQLMPDLPGSDIYVGGKLIEYLAFDKPILAVMPPGEGRRIVESIPTGRVADVEPGSVAAALERLLDAPPKAARSDPEGLYDRVRQAGLLAELLDRVAAGQPVAAATPSGAAAGTGGDSKP